jgi:hypothetical protein
MSISRELPRQMTEQRAHVGERDKIHKVGDRQRPGARPVRAAVLGE